MGKTIALVAPKKFDDDVTREVVLTVETSEKYNMLDILSSTDKYSLVNNECPLKIDSWNGLPVLIYDNESIFKNNALIRYSVGLLDTYLVEMNLSKEKIVDTILSKPSFSKLPKEHLGYFVDFVLGDLNAFYKKELAIKVEYRQPFLNPLRSSVVKSAIDQMALQASLTSTYVSAGQNVMIKQEKPEDRFFIQLPNFEQFKGNSMFSSLVPDIRLLFVPFNHKAYYSPIWTKLMGCTAERRRIAMMEESMYKAGIKFYEEDLSTWIEYPKTHILGNTENDDLPIMDNEIEWYNAFINFIKLDLKDSCGEDIAASMAERGGLTAEMEAFFDELLEVVLRLNWSCSGKFAMSGYSGIDDEESDDSLAQTDQEMREGIEGSTYYHYANESGADGIEAIKSHIKGIARGTPSKVGSGCKTYAEAIIKLARWGDRRPANLILEGDSSLFSLSDFTLQREVINFDKMVVKKTNGRSLSLLGAVRLTWVLNDKVYLNEREINGKISDATIGLITMRSFEGDRGLSQIVYLSLIDVVSEYINGNHFIDGLDFKDNKFIISGVEGGYSEELVTVANNLNEGRDSVLHITKRLEDVSRDIGVKAIELTDIAILQNLSSTPAGSPSIWFKGLICENKQDVSRILEEKGIPSIMTMRFRIAKHILPIYFKYADLIKQHKDRLEAADVFAEVPLVDSLTIMRAVMQAQNVQNSTSFYTIDESVKKDSANMLKKLEAFGAETKEPTATDTSTKEPTATDTSTKESILQAYIFEAHNEVKVVYPVVCSVKASGGAAVKKTVAYWGSVHMADPAGKPKQVGILFSEEELLPEMVKNSTVIDISQLTIYFLRIIMDIAENKESNLKVLLFASLFTAGKILKSFK